MTSKPTARERFQQIKNTPFGSTEDAINEISFLLSLVEAAEFMSQKTEDMFWHEINQRVAEGEGNK